MTTSPDSYAATAGSFDLFMEGFRAAQRQALRVALPFFRPDVGPVLDIGCGSGALLAEVLVALPTATALALEPSPAMRSLAISRFAGQPQWRDRVTVRPETLAAAPLPPAIAGAIMLGVLGHLSPAARVEAFDLLAARLPPGGALLLDLQHPEVPRRMESTEFADTHLGDLRYRGLMEATPLGGELMRWRMTYQVLDAGRVLEESTTEHEYHHPPHAVVMSEADQAGLDLEPVADGSFLLARSR